MQKCSLPIESHRAPADGPCVIDSTAFLDRGWVRLPFNRVMAHWAGQTLPAARRAVEDPQYAKWRRCGGTWFAGVNALANDARGAVADGAPLTGPAVDFIQQLGLKDFAWDRGQISVCYPGYPQPMETESAAAYRYRRERDAAHIDGLLHEGPGRRRHLREYHAFILGIPLLETSADASPFVVWEGSHHLVRAAFQDWFLGVRASDWGDIDITDPYHELRRRVFDSCTRVEIPATPGECYLVHRLALHGVAPWAPAATASADGRMICYFRPEIGGPWGWLNNP